MADRALELALDFRELVMAFLALSTTLRAAAELARRSPAPPGELPRGRDQQDRREADDGDRPVAFTVRQAQLQARSTASRCLQAAGPSA